MLVFAFQPDNARLADALGLAISEQRHEPAAALDAELAGGLHEQAEVLAESPGIGILQRHGDGRLAQDRAVRPLRRLVREGLLDERIPLAYAKAHQCACPEKSMGMRHSATRTFFIGAGVLRLRPTKRGTPSVITAATAAMSPFFSASSAVFFDPPTQASRITTSASFPSLRNPELSRYTRALLPVAAAIAHSTGMPARLARCVIVYIIPSGMMPEPVGVSV